MAVATIGALAALGSAGAGAYSASKQQGGGNGSPNLQTIPAPAYAQGLQSLIARTLAGNLNARAPSLTEFADSGGTATFPMSAIQMTPQEAAQLKFTGLSGEPVPYFDPRQQGRLSPDQVLFTGQQRMTRRSRGDKMGAESLAEKYARLTQQDERLRNLIASGSLRPKQAAKAQSSAMATAGQLETIRDNLFSTERRGVRLPGQDQGWSPEWASGGGGGASGKSGNKRRDAVELGKYILSAGLGGKGGVFS